MRRQLAEGACAPAWSERALNPDPYDLPAMVASPPGGILAEVTPEHVVLHGAGFPGGGLIVPISLYQGVAMSVVSDARSGRITAQVSLEHENVELRVPLFVADNTFDIVARWQSWAKELRLPLLLRDLDGSLLSPLPRLGKLQIRRVRPRRLDARVLKRRPLMVVKRRPWGPPPQERIAGREIIARD